MTNEVDFLRAAQDLRSRSAHVAIKFNREANDLDYQDISGHLNAFFDLNDAEGGFNAPLDHYWTAAGQPRQYDMKVYMYSPSKVDDYLREASGLFPSFTFQIINAPQSIEIVGKISGEVDD